MKKFSKVLVLFVLGLSLWASEAIIGTWKLNVAKSKYSPGPPPKSATVTYEATAEGLKRTGETIDAEGNATSFQYTAMYNGQYYPVTGSNLYDAIKLTSISSRITVATLKKSGKVVSHARRVVSEDGKTMTLTITGTNGKGQKTKDIAIYEKQ